MAALLTTTGVLFNGFFLLFNELDVAAAECVSCLFRYGMRYFELQSV